MALILIELHKMKDIESIAKTIDELAIRLSNELADSFAHNVSGNLNKIASEQECFVEKHCIKAASDALARFPRISRADQTKLKNRAVSAAKAAFKRRLMKLGRDRS